MSVGPFGELCLRAHHAGDRRDVGVNEPVFLASVTLGEKAGGENKLNHEISPKICSGVGSPCALGHD
jgi:hypothetical protein